MIAHLNKPEYVHVLLNPLPVYGLALGVIGLIIALLLRTRTARVTALALVLLSGASAWPVYQYGEAGYDRVKAMVDEDGDKWLEEHMRRGEQLIYVFYLVAALSVVGIIAEFAVPKTAVPLAITTLILAIASLGVGGYIAYAGGRVRHKEFRFEAPPEPKNDNAGRVDIASRLQHLPVGCRKSNNVVTFSIRRSASIAAILPR
jgi:glucan phosphoethanolaminetransferase (alkaline phosphatase superfamily)